MPKASHSDSTAHDLSQLPAGLYSYCIPTLTCLTVLLAAHRYLLSASKRLPIRTLHLQHPPPQLLRGLHGPTQNAMYSSEPFLVLPIGGSLSGLWTPINKSLGKEGIVLSLTDNCVLIRSSKI